MNAGKTLPDHEDIMREVIYEMDKIGGPVSLYQGLQLKWVSEEWFSFISIASEVSEKPRRLSDYRIETR